MGTLRGSVWLVYGSLEATESAGQEQRNEDQRRASIFDLDRVYGEGTGERQAFSAVDLKRGIGTISQFSLRELGSIRTQGRMMSAGCHGKGRRIP